MTTYESFSEEIRGEIVDFVASCGWRGVEMAIMKETTAQLITKCLKLQEHTLSVEQAIEVMNGHAVMSSYLARLVCKTLQVPMDEHLVVHWNSMTEARDKLGFFASEAPADGVDGLQLSYHVCRVLGIEAPGYTFTGKEFQARANRDAIRKAVKGAIQDE